LSLRKTRIKEVVEHYNSSVDSTSPNLDSEMMHFAKGLNLSDQEKVDLIAFLKTFSDYSFLSNPDFSDPN